MLVLCLSVNGQELKVTGSRKAVRTSGDILVFITPVASLTTVLATQDWRGLKQGVFARVTTLSITCALKYSVKKERPDFSDNHSFPSMRTSVSFAGAIFIRGYHGRKWGIPAHAVSTRVGRNRVYGEEHDQRNMAAGAVIGVGSAYILTHPLAKKHNLPISPVVGGGHYGTYASATFQQKTILWEISNPAVHYYKAGFSIVCMCEICKLALIHNATPPPTPSELSSGQDTIHHK